MPEASQNIYFPQDGHRVVPTFTYSIWQWSFQSQYEIAIVGNWAEIYLNRSKWFTNSYIAASLWAILRSFLQGSRPFSLCTRVPDRATVQSLSLLQIDPRSWYSWLGCWDSHVQMPFESEGPAHPHQQLIEPVSSAGWWEPIQPSPTHPCFNDLSLQFLF